MFFVTIFARLNKKSESKPSTWFGSTFYITDLAHLSRDSLPVLYLFRSLCQHFFANSGRRRILTASRCEGILNTNDTRKCRSPGKRPPEQIAGVLRLTIGILPLDSANHGKITLKYSSLTLSLAIGFIKPLEKLPGLLCYNLHGFLPVLSKPMPAPIPISTQEQG